MKIKKLWNKNAYAKNNKRKQAIQSMQKKCKCISIGCQEDRAFLEMMSEDLYMVYQE